ncbi:MgtC/SapB family protein [Hahella aquimaris]|uniref:MgtC/SapB family protein n=1 Tax=Hahella sp. HNIBRBA332 TaxID=3015983 RepID=UPI00273C4F98|nr:MgtC/SapB family protein [Hahella sp. HNIBRBA332]WLQ13694.1 MgtC/SapB family protein [Hahella sp. HNIBRBA332]
MNNLIDAQYPLPHLAVALLLGLTIGIQRGWVNRNEEAGHRVAGVRTFALIALLGGLATWLGEQMGEWVLAAGIIALALILIAAYVTSQKQRLDMSITSLIASMLTFFYGALCVMGEFSVAATMTVVTAIMLDLKPELHGFLKKIRDEELDAGLKLLVMTVVMLPVLPNEGFGPWNAINPYEVWWMIVLISAISFVGYFAVKIGGPSKGILITSLFAGLSSSTALTLHLSRVAKDNQEHAPLLASGVLIACGTMFPRLLLVIYIVHPPLAYVLAPPFALMALCVYAAAFYFWRSHSGIKIEQPNLKQNPLEISSALFFGFLLLFIMLLSNALHEWLGASGVYALSAISGLSDVDAISLSLARLAKEPEKVALLVAAWGIFIAVCSNNLVKAGLAWTIGNRPLGIKVAAALAASGIAGLAILLLNPIQIY